MNMKMKVIIFDKCSYLQSVIHNAVFLSSDASVCYSVLYCS